MTTSTWIPGETLTEPAAKLTDFPSTDLTTTGLGLNSAVPREVPCISAEFDSDEPDVAIVSVAPQPNRRHTDNTAVSFAKNADRAFKTSTRPAN